MAFYYIHFLRSKQSVRSTASFLGVSASFMFCRLKDISYPKPSSLPRVLSIDEFRGNTINDTIRMYKIDHLKMYKSRVS